MKQEKERTCSGFMRRTRSEGFQWGKTDSGKARWRERELCRKSVEDLESLLRLASRVRDEVPVVLAVEPEFLRCGGTYDIVLSVACTEGFSEREEWSWGYGNEVCVNERFVSGFQQQNRDIPTWTLLLNLGHGGLFILVFTGLARLSWAQNRLRVTLLRTSPNAHRSFLKKEKITPTKSNLPKSYKLRYFYFFFWFIFNYFLLYSNF